MSVHPIPAEFLEDYQNSIRLQERWVRAIPNNGRYTHIINDTHICLESGKGMDIPKYLRLIRSHLAQPQSPEVQQLDQLNDLKKLNAQQIRSVHAHNAIEFCVLPIVVGIALVVIAVLLAVELVFPMGIILFALLGTLCLVGGSIGMYFAGRVKKQCIEEGDRLVILLQSLERNREMERLT